MDGPQENTEVGEDNQLQFVLILKKYQVLLNKSQIPAIKAEKRVAASKMVEELEKTLLMTLTEEQLGKKINNMKTAFKKKTDVNQTGNKKSVLAPWEKSFQDLVRADTNPVYSKVPGALSMGINLQTPTKNSTVVSSQTQSLVPTGITFQKRPKDIPPRPDSAKKMKSAEKVLESVENEDTKQLSTSQLQRYVLLTQLQLLQAKLQRLNNENSNSLD